MRELMRRDGRKQAYLRSMALWRTRMGVIVRPSKGYIVKPFNAQTLKTKIEEVLADAR
jgi:hypothetical protein